MYILIIVYSVQHILLFFLLFHTAISSSTWISFLLSIYMVLGIFRVKCWPQLFQLIRLYTSKLHSQTWERNGRVLYTQSHPVWWGWHWNDGSKVEHVNRGKAGVCGEGEMQLSWRHSLHPVLQTDKSGRRSECWQMAGGTLFYLHNAVALNHIPVPSV